MQIRVVSKKIQLLRSEYIPAKRTPEGHMHRGTGRSTQKVIASFDKWLTEPPKDILEQLTKDEIKQVKTWLKEWREENRKKDLEVAIDLVAGYMNRAAQGIEECGVLEAKKIRAIKRAWANLNKALLRHRIFGGIDLTEDFPELGNSALYCVTEIHSKKDIDTLVASLKEAIEK